MKRWLKELDELLRGERTARLNSDSLDISVSGMAFQIVVLAALYGVCMGSFAMARGIEIGNQTAIWNGIMQTTASSVKMPLLFLCTLCITFPSLYVFSALVGSRLKIQAVLRLLLAGLAVNLAVLASLGPIVAFFSVSTPNYGFVLLLNVFCCTLAGMLGLVFLLQTLYRMTRPTEVLQPDVASTFELATELTPGETTPIQVARQGPLRKTGSHILGRHVRKVFWIWIVVFGLVGAQMGWVLRPFIGSPTQPFSWLRSRESSVFESIVQSLQGLVS